jgi:hypothetical protein
VLGSPNLGASHEFGFAADNPGPALFHCDRQLRMDFGVKASLTDI